jgi:hypothetical protein
VDQGAWGSTATVEELSIGVESGADEYMFGSIRGIAVDDHGNIYVADGRPAIVRKYDGAGTFLTNIGRQGQGPGEYAYGPVLGIHPAGMLVARDQTRRVTFFTLEREYLDSFPVVGFTSLIIERAGDILVQHGATSRRRSATTSSPRRIVQTDPLLTWREPWTYDVFEPDGTFLGSAVVPELFNPVVIRGEQLWGTRTDEEGVQRVLRLRVVPESP